MVLPNLSPGDIVIIDNLGSHRSPAASLGCQTVALPAALTYPVALLDEVGHGSPRLSLRPQLGAPVHEVLAVRLQRLYVAPREHLHVGKHWASKASAWT